MQSSKPIKGVLRTSACVASSMLAATALSETVINLAEQVWTGKYDLGTLQLHGDKLEGWLEDVDFMTYSSRNLMSTPHNITYTKDTCQVFLLVRNNGPFPVLVS